MIDFFSAYSGRDKQNLMSMLNKLESAGVTDIRFAREQLQKSIDAQYAEAKLASPGPRWGKPSGPRFGLCPQCGKPLQKIAPLEGLQRIGCSCHYSQVI